MKRFFRFTSICICAILLCLCITPASVNAAGSRTATINIELQYGQTEARDMLQMINTFRTNQQESWVWNQSNTEKIYYSNLAPLQYDYTLEKAAMLRAAEIALSYSHTRPNGTNCFSACENIAFTSLGENIAAGYPTGASVFEGWQETNDPYDGQGHRRNMLNDSFNTIGIGHVYFNGTHYWVQEFATVRSADTTSTPANDAKSTVSLEVLSSNISNVSLTCSETSLTLSEGEQLPLPATEVTAVIADHFPRNLTCPIIPQENADSTITWTSSNPSVADITSNESIQALAEGTATLTASWNDLTATCKVTVMSASGSGNSSNSNMESSGDDELKEPDFVTIPKVTLNNVKNSATGKAKVTWKKLSSVDGYTIAYSANKNFSSAKTKTAGSLTKTATISKLKKGKTYYFRVRAYKNVNGSTFYGSWSNTKKVKINK